MIAKYNIPEKNLATLRAKLEILNRRAVRLGVPTISLRSTGNVQTVETKVDRDERNANLRAMRFYRYKGIRLLCHLPWGEL